MATTKMSMHSACAYAYAAHAKPEAIGKKMITGTNKHPRVFNILESCTFVPDEKRPNIDLIVYDGRTVGWVNTATGVNWFDDAAYAKIVKTLPVATESIADDDYDIGDIDGDHDD